MIWPFKKKLRQRRLEVRRNIPSVSASRWKCFVEAGGVGSVLLVGGLFLALVLMDASPLEPVPYRPGQYIPKDIHARVPFRILSHELQDELLRKADSTAPPIFKLNSSLIDEISIALRNLPEQIKTTTQPSDIDKTLQQQFAFSTEEVKKIRKLLGDPHRRERYDNSVRVLQAELRGIYIVQFDELLTPVWRSADTAILLEDNNKTQRYRSDLISLTEEGKVARKIDELTASFDKAVQPHLKAYLKNVFGSSRPTYAYDAASTQRNIEQARRIIETTPPDEAYKEYAEGQLLVRQSRRKTPEGERTEGLNDAEIQLLAEEHLQYLSTEELTHPWRRWGRFIGRAVVVLLTVSLLSLYIAHYQPRIVKNHWRGLAVILVLLLMTALSRGMVFGANLNPYSVLVAVLLGTIIFTIAYNQRFALAMGAMGSVLIVLQLRLDLAMLMVFFSAVAAVAFQLREIRTRSKLVEVSAIIAVVVLVAIWALGMARTVPWKFVLLDSTWGAGMALLAGLFVQAILPLIERTFGIATSMTLLEWCDASKPLLKRLAMEAPGTYNHSLQLGAMCETAAESIGARGLLGRVGAYYHDIGKINKPTYFVENQAGSPSKHDKLSPAMSLLIIIGHVKDGLEMAREYSLPPVLHEFIATHHGTTLVEYFYHIATSQRNTDTDRAPDEVEFRYQGPKPRTKETGILMLADASESSVRAMSEPTPGRIEDQVQTMVNRRLMDGQLDECNMTLKEVHQVAVSLTKSLCGIYHARIAYPTPTGQKPSPAELDREKKLQSQPSDPVPKEREAQQHTQPE